MNHSKTNNNKFFFHITLALSILVFAGFTLNHLFNEKAAIRDSVWVILHGILNGLWFVLLTAQTALIGGGRRKLHMKLGQSSIILAISLVVVGVIMVFDLAQFIIKGDEFDPADPAKQSNLAALFWGTLMQWVAFVYLYVHALMRRRDADTHKRLMVFTGLVMCLAGITRLLGLVGLPGPVGIGVVLLFVIWMLVHDRKQLGRFHGATWIGLVTFVLMILSFFTLGQSQWFVGLVGNWVETIT